jgi:hypothetical protein
VRSDLRDGSIDRARKIDAGVDERAIEIEDDEFDVPAHCSAADVAESLELLALLLVELEQRSRLAG